MSDIDPNQEWNQLTEVYRQMVDEELLKLASQESELTEIARNVLRGEMHTRGLKYEPPKLTRKPRETWRVMPPVLAEHDQTQTLAGQRIQAECLGGGCSDTCDLDGTGLIEWDRANNLQEALRVRDILAAENISVVFGKEMVDDPEEITSYEGGIPVIISAYDRQRAQQAWATANPEEYKKWLEENATEDEQPDTAASCPSCGSFDIVLMGVDGDGNAAQDYHWQCDACGHSWTDDGVAQYKPLPQTDTEENL